MMVRSSRLLDVIRKLHVNHKREDGEVFYDKRLDAMLEASPICSDSTNLSRERGTASLHNKDAGCSLQAIDDGQHRKLKSTRQDQLEIEAPDAWI